MGTKSIATTKFPLAGSRANPDGLGSSSSSRGGRVSRLDCERHWTQIWTCTDNLKELEKSKDVESHTVPKPYIVEYKNVIMLRRIGEGGQGLIYEGICNNQKVAVKLYKAHNVQYQMWPQDIFKIHSNNICRPLFAIKMDDASYSLAMELYGSDLRRILDKHVKEHKNKGQLCAPPFNLLVTVDLILQIAMGMETLHQRGLVHRDLKSANVLVLNEEPFIDGTFLVGLSDFETDCIGGTGFWRAPEILQALENTADLPINERTSLPFTREADVYSFGMTCFEIFSGSVPFEDYPKSSFDVILSGNRPKLSTDLDEDIKQLIWSCWNGDPSARPTFTMILSELVELIAKTPGLESILHRVDVFPSKGISKLRLEMEEFKRELENLKPHDPESLQRGVDFLKSVETYLVQCDLKVSCADQPFNNEKRAVYEEALRLYEEAHKKCRDFHEGCCVEIENEELNCKYFSLLNFSTGIAFRLP